MFDSSVVRGTPATFPLNRVITGWTEGVQLMVAGEKRRLWIPEALAYKGQRESQGHARLRRRAGRHRRPARPPTSRRRPPTPRSTASGLAYKVLKPGTGAPFIREPPTR